LEERQIELAEEVIRQREIIDSMLPGYLRLRDTVDEMKNDIWDLRRRLRQSTRQYDELDERYLDLSGRLERTLEQPVEENPQVVGTNVVQQDVVEKNTEAEVEKNAEAEVDKEPTRNVGHGDAIGDDVPMRNVGDVVVGTSGPAEDDRPKDPEVHGVAEEDSSKGNEEEAETLTKAIGSVEKAPVEQGEVKQGPVEPVDEAVVDGGGSGRNDEEAEMTQRQDDDDQMNEELADEDAEADDEEGEAKTGNGDEGPLSPLSDTSTTLQPNMPPPPTPLLKLQPPTPVTSQEAASSQPTTHLEVPSDPSGSQAPVSNPPKASGRKAGKSTPEIDSEPRRSPRLRSKSPTPSALPAKRQAEGSGDERSRKKARE